MLRREPVGKRSQVMGRGREKATGVKVHGGEGEQQGMSKKLQNQICFENMKPNSL